MRAAAGSDGARRHRHWPWLVAALVILPVALDIGDGRPRASMAEEAAAYSVKRAADPVTTPGEAVLKTATDALLGITTALWARLFGRCSGVG